MPKKPPTAPKPYDRLQGGERKAVQLLVPAADHKTLRLAAASEGVPLAAFALAAALDRAKKILTNPANGH